MFASIIALCLLPAMVAGAQPSKPEKSPPSAGAASQTERNKQRVREALDKVFNAHQLAMVDEYFTENYKQHNPHAGQGRQSVKSYFGMLFTGFPDWKGEIDHILAEGDKVIMVVTWSGTHKGEFMGVKPTGKRVTIQTADIIRLENGKFAEHWDVVADQPMWEALGFIQKVR
jgi:predicted SnoaL-like aldol condensation-catalyzing enzyme